MNWYEVSQYININEVIENPHLPWNKAGLSRNRGITVAVIEMDLPNATDDWVMRTNDTIEWSLSGLSENKELIVEDILYIHV